MKTKMVRAFDYGYDFLGADEVFDLNKSAVEAGWVSSKKVHWNNFDILPVWDSQAIVEPNSQLK